MARRNKILVILAATTFVIGFIALILRVSTAPPFKKLPSSPMTDVLPERSFHIINLSLPKTGTTSIRGIFSRYVSTRGEFMYQESVDKLLDWREGLIDGATLDKFLIERDSINKPHVDSVTFLFLAHNRVINLFPKAKFLLCVRDGEQWIVSFVNMLFDYFGPNQKGRNLNQSWVERYGKVMAPGFTREAFSDLERLKERVGPLLPDLAAFWGQTTLQTLRRLKQVPEDRRLILRTKDLSYSLDKLAKFAGVPIDSLDMKKTHLYKGKKPSQIRKLLGAENTAKAVKPWQEQIDAMLAEYD